MQLIRILFVLLMLVTKVFPYEVWIDPHDMNIDYNGRYKKSSGGDADIVQYCTKTDNIPNRSHIYLKRIINLILKSAYLQKDQLMAFYSGKINFNIEQDELQILKDYANNESDEEESTLRMLDGILSKAMKKPVFDEYTEIFSSWGIQAYYMIFNQTSAILFSVLFVLIMVYKLIRMKLSLWFIFTAIILLCFVVDCVVVYFHLLDEATIKQMAEIKSLGPQPPECDISKMGWFDYLFSNTEGKCLKYYKATHQNLFLMVSPFKVFSHQFGVLVVGPAAHLGKAIGGFVNGTLVELPWIVNVILLPIILIFSLLLLGLGFTFLFKTKFRINIFHMLQFDFDNRGVRHRPIQQETVRNIIYIDRPEIEEIQDAPQTTDNVEESRQSITDVKQSEPSSSTEQMIANESLSENDTTESKTSEQTVPSRKNSTIVIKRTVQI